MAIYTSYMKPSYLRADRRLRDRAPDQY